MNTLLRFSVLLSVAIALAGCFGTNEAAKARGEFLKGCISSGIDKDQCSCAYDKLEATYGKDQLVMFEKHPERAPDRLTYDTVSAMQVCTGQAPMPIPKAASPAPAASQAPLDGSQDYTRFEQAPDGTVMMKAADGSTRPAPAVVQPQAPQTPAQSSAPTAAPTPTPSTDSAPAAPSNAASQSSAAEPPNSL